MRAYWGEVQLQNVRKNFIYQFTLSYYYGVENYQGLAFASHTPVLLRTDVVQMMASSLVGHVLSTALCMVKYIKRY